jgi:hypothetical protein
MRDGKIKSKFIRLAKLDSNVALSENTSGNIFENELL